MNWVPVVDALGAALSGVILVLIARQLLETPAALSKVGRFGLGLIAAGVFLTLVERTFRGSPFQDWAYVILRLGIVLLLLRTTIISVKREGPNG